MSILKTLLMETFKEHLCKDRSTVRNNRRVYRAMSYDNTERLGTIIFEKPLNKLY